MTYPELTAQCRAKVARYTLAQCAHAIADCYATLELWPETTDYTIKLWAEIAACRDRRIALGGTSGTPIQLPASFAKRSK